MTRSTQQQSSRSTVKFALQKRGPWQQLQQSESEATARRRSRSPLPKVPCSDEAPELCKKSSCEIGKSEEATAQVPRPKGLHFALECQLEVTNASLSTVEKHLAELSATRAAVEEKAQAALATLEATKERRADFHKLLQAAVTTGQKALGDARAAVNSAEGKINSLIQDHEREAAALAAQSKAAKDTIADANAQICALQEAHPELGAAAGDSKLDKDEMPSVATAVAVEKAIEERKAAMEAKLAGLKEKRGEVLATLAAQGGTVGQLASRVVELEAKLETQCDTISQFQTRTKELGVDEDALLAMRPSVPTRKPPRLFAMSPALPEIAGDYKLLPDTVSDRPAYARKGSSGTAVYLFWSSAGGRCCWTFAEELPSNCPSEAGTAADGSGVATPGQLKGVLARSVQAAWTALPDELASSRWEAGSRAVDIMLVGKAS